MSELKSLMDWTLREVKENCAETYCFSCPFHNGIDSCMLINSNIDCPRDWHIHRFTEADRNDAFAVLRMFPWAEKIVRYSNELQVRAPATDGRIIDISTQMFSSVKPGMTVNLRDITQD